MINLPSATENIGDTKGIKSIVSDNKQKWKSQMTPKMIEKIEEIACPTLIKYNYPVSCSGVQKRLNPLRMRYYQLQDGWNLVTNSKCTDWHKKLIFHAQYFRVSGNRTK
jgi:hypothetical protein